MAVGVCQERTTEPEVTRQRRAMQELAREIRTIETAGRPAGSFLSSGCEVMDRCLPGGGWAPGSMIEWIHGGDVHNSHAMPTRGLGTVSLALRVGLQAMAGGKYLVLLDRYRQFYLPGLLGMGFPSERLIVLQPKNDADAIWGMDQALRSPAVGAVVATVHRLDDRVARRLQLATEQGGGLGMLVRDAQAAKRDPSWAEVKWRVRSAMHVRDWQTRWFDLELLRAAGGMTGKRIRVGLDTRGTWIENAAIGEQHGPTGAMHLAAELAKPAYRRREAAS